ncbi:hypothetical protein J4H41_09655 [Vibrio alginolyticus]|uniref:hypothetical protein n=1 Tax=Vibrio alginolyticus TaxID=663 RepID=UPI001BD2C8E7|nr:hypothetical protein [Vibrio alginolyticus]MBS9896570.1 hypothetical protein [Vibrio alginolyticus]
MKQFIPKLAAESRIDTALIHDSTGFKTDLKRKSPSISAGALECGGSEEIGLPTYLIEIK